VYHTGYQLAQVNVARLREPLDAPGSSGFVAAVDRINRLAERSPGFVWRSSTSHTGTAADPLTIVNLSVWESYEHLHAFVYRSTHGHYVRRRDEWFQRIPTPATALWWVPAGHRPTTDEALARLRHLRTHGPRPQAFTVRRRFDPDSSADAGPRSRAGTGRPGGRPVY
jgi:hypothetical protein